MSSRQTNQAFTWVQKALAGLAPEAIGGHNITALGGSAAEAILRDWGVKAAQVIPTLGSWIEEHIRISLSSGRPISWQWDVCITLVLLQLAGIHTLFITDGGATQAATIVKAAGLSGNSKRTAITANWKKGLITTQPGFHVPGSMCQTKDLGVHQLEGGARYLQSTTIDLLTELAGEIKVRMGNEFMAVSGSKNWTTR
jgi:hypothetical protein